MTKLTIDRTKWLRGCRPSYLRAENETMCCLGFYCLEKGYTKEEIQAITCPNDLICADVLLPELVFYNENSALKRRNLDITKKLMEINDDYILSKEQRESLLKEEFAKLRVEVEFVN